MIQVVFTMMIDRSLTLTNSAVDAAQVNRIFEDSSMTTLPFSLKSSKFWPKKIKGRANTIVVS